MRRGLAGLLLSAASLMTLGVAAPAVAQSAPAADRASGATELDEVVVTARRKEENVQSVPLAVQAFSGETLGARHIENATDLSKSVPALTASQSSRDEENYVIRGMSGSGASISGQQVTVPTYMSQVPLPIGDGGGPGRYFDLQNVQVLKGPQGTLFGRNSTGGAVLFEPRRPGRTFGGYIQGQVGNYNDRGFEGAVNLPLGDTLSVRLALKTEQRDGFTENIVTHQDQDDRNYISGRASVLWTPTGSFDNLFVFDAYNSHTNGGSNHLTAVNPAAIIPTLLGGQVQAALAQQNALGPRKAISSVRGLDKIQAWGFSNISTFRVNDNLTFKNILGYRRLEQVNRFDYDGTFLTLLDFDICSSAATCHTMSPAHPWGLNIAQWTDELQAQGRAFGDKLNYTVGLFYLKLDTPQANYLHQTSVFGSPTDINQFVRDRSKAVYGQFTYDLSDLVQGLKFTAGYRRTNDERGLTIYQVASGKCVTGAIGALAPDPANAPQCRGDVGSKFTSDSYTVGFDYKISDNALIYLTHRKGYRAGGVNPLAGPALLAVPPIPNAASLFTYAPEFLKDVELGVKADWRFSGMSLRTNVAVYDEKLKNAQLNQTFTVGTSTVSALVNSADADVKGAEVELTLVPVEGLTIDFAYAYTDASYGPYLDYSRRNPVTNAPTLSNGRIFPFTPRNKGNLAVRWKLPTPEAYGDITASVNWAYKSEITLGLVPFITLAGGVNVPDGESIQKPTNTVDFNLDWKRIGGSRIDAAFFVTNLTDVTYKIGGASLINSGLGVNQRIYNEPRMVGLQLRYSFGE